MYSLYLLITKIPFVHLMSSTLFHAIPSTKSIQKLYCIFIYPFLHYKIFHIFHQSIFSIWITYDNLREYTSFHVQICRIVLFSIKKRQANFSPFPKRNRQTFTHHLGDTPSPNFSPKNPPNWHSKYGNL